MRPHQNRTGSELTTDLCRGANATRIIWCADKGRPCRWLTCADRTKSLLVRFPCRHTLRTPWSICCSMDRTLRARCTVDAAGVPTSILPKSTSLEKKNNNNKKPGFERSVDREFRLVPPGVVPPPHVAEGQCLQENNLFSQNPRHIECRNSALLRPIITKFSGGHIPGPP